MTDTEKAELVASVEALASQLDEARQNVATLQRLKTAELDVERLAIELEAAQSALAKGMADAVCTQRKAQFAGFIDITVIETPDPMNSSVLSTTFVIAVTRRSFNGYQSVPTTITYPSFKQLPPDAFNYLLEKHPERVPASIMALRPGDAWNAFNTYFVGLKRGYLTASDAE